MTETKPDSPTAIITSTSEPPPVIMRKAEVEQLRIRLTAEQRGEEMNQPQPAKDSETMTVTKSDAPTAIITSTSEPPPVRIEAEIDQLKIKLITQNNAEINSRFAKILPNLH